MSRSIYLVTHSQKDDGANPGLTPIGLSQAGLLRRQLPTNLKVIVCGTGKRHLAMSKALGLKPTRYSFIFGMPESKNRATNTVILADGTEVAYDLYTSVTDRADLFIKYVNLFPHLTAIITSRSMVKLLMKEGDAKEAAIYRYQPETKALLEIFAASDDIGAGAKEV